jgi:DNA polymerase III subunit chi
MTKIDFYILSDKSKQAPNLFACKLIEKAYALGHQLFVFCQNEEHAFEMDELLWSYDASSFIPHNLQGEGPRQKPAVQIGFGQDASGYQDILINLAHQIPHFYGQFQRVCEIIPNQEEIKEIKRQSFRYYKEQNNIIQTHSIE